MNPPLQFKDPPNPPTALGMQKDWKAIVQKVGEMARWSRDLGVWIHSTVIDPVQTKVNGLTSGFSTASSSSTVQLSTAVTHVTGTNTITNLTPGQGFSGVAWLIADGAFSLGTGGNIALARGPYTVGQAVKVIYDSSTGMWYPE